MAMTEYWHLDVSRLGPLSNILNLVHNEQCTLNLLTYRS